MSTESITLPTDPFSKRLRELTANPAAVRSSSTIQLEDPYGNLDSWIVDTFRADGKEEVLLQRIAASGGAIRLALPPEVMAAIARHRSRANKVNRRRGARQALETKRERGIDPAAAIRGRGGRRKVHGTVKAARITIERGGK